MATKTVYQLDEAGIYIGLARAFESPLEPGVFNLPAGCVFEAPPELQAQQAAVWSDDGWLVLPDHRGETWFVGGNPVVIDFVGDPAERGYTAPTGGSLAALFEVARQLVDNHVDAVARAKGYNDAVACATYVTSTNATWASEAVAFLAWRDAVWTQVFSLRDQAVAGEISTLPSGAELIAALPAIVWPS